VIFDSCILIDISRQNPLALNFATHCPMTPSVSALTVTEVLRGVRNVREQALFDQIFHQWQVVPVTLHISTLAAEFLRLYHASHGLDMVDAIIAASAKIHELELVTLNLKHFPMFPGIARPYGYQAGACCLNGRRGCEADRTAFLVRVNQVLVRKWPPLRSGHFLQRLGSVYWQNL